MKTYEGRSKFCNSAIKKDGNVTNSTLFFNIITTQFNALRHFFWQTVNSTKIQRVSKNTPTFLAVT